LNGGTKIDEIVRPFFYWQKPLTHGGGETMQNQAAEIQKVPVSTVRKMQRRSQMWLAHKTGIPQPTLSQIENGWIQPSPAVLEKIGEALGIPGHMLMVPAEPRGRWD
jgi:DNA-binding XRE family transcriptional regulator